MNRFWKEDLQPEGGAGAGLLRGKEDLAKAYAALGITPDKPVIVYCNSGHMASLVYRSLHDVLAYPNVRLYDGSWLEWSITPDAAKETGPAKKRQD